MDGKVQGEHGHGIEGMAPTEAHVQARPGPRLLRADNIDETRVEVELRKRGASNAGYHYLGSAKTFARIGKAFAEALLDLRAAAEAP